MTTIDLSYWQLGFAASAIVALYVVLVPFRQGLSRSLLVSTVRLVIQLSLIGYVLKFLFEDGHLLYVVLLSVVMLTVASREMVARQKRRIKGVRALGIGAATVFVSSFAISLYGLLVVVRPDPWYMPQYAIPLLGMIMSNTMSAISLAMDRLTNALYEQQALVEQKLALGYSAKEAIRPYVSDCIRTGMMPVINSMAAAGIVALPGMMTGQILGGVSPQVAVKYQIMIWFFIAASCGFGMVTALRLLGRVLFDDRDRLRLDRLEAPKH